MKNIGVYSGSFDPIHQGHLDFAQAAIEQARLEKVFFLVEPRPRRKQGVKAFEHRTRMVQLAIADQPAFGSIVLDQPRFTTMQTLPALLKRFHGAQLHLLIGDDVVHRLHEWSHLEQLAHAVHFVIASRRSKPDVVRQHLALVAETLNIKLHFQLISVQHPEYASSRIRQSVKQGKTAPGLLPVIVDYIREAGLYASAKTS